MSETADIQDTSRMPCQEVGLGAGYVDLFIR